MSDAAAVLAVRYVVPQLYLFDVVGTDYLWRVRNNENVTHTTKKKGMLYISSE
jgi:hypothetical protein